jgi:hypothetical protein
VVNVSRSIIRKGKKEEMFYKESQRVRFPKKVLSLKKCGISVAESVAATKKCGTAQAT